MNIAGHDIAVCSWSLRPGGMADLAGKVRQLGLEHVQLALAPLIHLDDKRKHEEVGQLRASGIKVTATMISFPGEDYSSIPMIRETGGVIPEKDWPLRRELCRHGAVLSAELGVKSLTFHIGAVPLSNHRNYAAAVDRIREISRLLAEQGVELLMETGQEHAHELLQFLNDVAARNVLVNFDPANMILYGAGDPIESIEILGRHIRHVHVKDAILSAQPGVKWGEEVPFGAGQVGPRRFLQALREIGYAGPLAIEREGGEDRMGDVQAAIEALKAAGGVMVIEGGHP